MCALAFKFVTIVFSYSLSVAALQHYEMSHFLGKSNVFHWRWFIAMHCEPCFAVHFDWKVWMTSWFKRCEHTYKAFHPFFPQIRSGLLGNWWNLHWVLLCVSFVKTCRNFINKKFPRTIKQQTNHARQEFFAKGFYYIEYIYIFNFKHSGTYI